MHYCKVLKILSRTALSNCHSLERKKQIHALFRHIVNLYEVCHHDKKQAVRLRFKLILVNHVLNKSKYVGFKYLFFLCIKQDIVIRGIVS